MINIRLSIRNLEISFDIGKGDNWVYLAEGWVLEDMDNCS